MSEIRTLDAAATADLLPFGPLTEAIAAVLAEAEAGTLFTPERTAHALPAGGRLLLMPAADERLLIVKVVTVVPDNRRRGLPTIQGDFLIKDAATGAPLLALDAATVTTRRTAALTLLGARVSGVRRAASALLIGAGAQARVHAEAFRERLGVDRFLVASRSAAGAEALAAELRSAGVEAHPAADVRTAAAGVDVVLAATTSTEPVVPADVPDNVFVAAVGAFRRGMAELPVELLRRREVVVDTLEGARAEAGDLIAAAEAGAWDWRAAVPLGELLSALTPSAERPRLFKSVGHAAFDLAAARLAVRSGAQR